jgi:integrase
MSGRELPAVAGAGEVLDTAQRALAVAGQALELASMAALAQGYARASRAANTNRAYAADWAHVSRWCAGAGRSAVPMAPHTLCDYLAAHAATHTPETLRRRLAAIAAVHAAAGQESPSGAPSVRAVLKGIFRRHARPPHQATPLVLDSMRAVLATLGEDPRGVRDRALLLVGWGAALRRGELVGLDRRDVVEVAEGLVVTVRQSKTLRPGDTRVIGIPHNQKRDYDPAAAWARWVMLLGDRAVPLFRAVDAGGAIHTTRLADRTVARLVARVAARAGLEGSYSGHSLRAGAALHAIMGLTGHRSAEMALRYVRPTQLFSQNAAAVAAL